MKKVICFLSALFISINAFAYKIRVADFTVNANGCVTATVYVYTDSNSLLFYGTIDNGHCGYTTPSTNYDFITEHNSYYASDNIVNAISTDSRLKEDIQTAITEEEKNKIK